MKSIFIIVIFLICSITANSQVGIGTTMPDASSMLDVTAIDKGLLIPRVSLLSASDVTTITTPTVSLLVYNSGFSPNGYYYFNGTIWVQLGVAASASSDWTIFGNTNIVDGTNFLGTGASTNIDVAFRRNNLAAGKIGANSTSFGVGALSNGSASNATAIGNNALTANTTGTNNVGVGNGALATNIVGASNTAVGSGALNGNTATGNTAVGFNALRVNSNAGNNTAVGTSALAANTTATGNTAVGASALAANTTAVGNTAVGSSALAANTATNNTAIGTSALAANTTGLNNTAVGFNALTANTGTGNRNTAVGASSLLTTNGGTDNTALGSNALERSITTASWNTAVGSSALQNIANAAAQNNVAVGYFAMREGTGNINQCVAIGSNAGRFVAGNNCTAVGYNALSSNTGSASSGTDNVAIGQQSLRLNNAGQQNVAVGGLALQSNVSGSFNTAIGHQAGNGLSTGTNNTFLGFQAGSTNSVGVNNTFVGYQAGNIGSNNVAIGYLAGNSDNTSNKLYITNSGTNTTTSLIYGDFSSKILRTNSTFQINDPATTGYVFPVARGTNQQVLTTNATGILSWATPAIEIDPQVSSVTTNVVPKWNGTTLVDSIITDDGTTATVAGNLKSTNFQMTNGAVANYVLQSDAAGNATWAAPNNSFSSVRTNLASNQSLTTSGWQKINFSTEVYDSNSEFATGTFTATKAGNYNVNAGYHTTSQANTEYYSIGVYVNDTLYQQTTSNHFGNGPVSRNINCNVNLLVGGTIEIYIENYENSVNIDSFSGKTFFEVQQNK